MPNTKTTKKETTTTTELFADTNISMKSGRLVKDAELISEGKFVKFRLATNKKYHHQGEVKTTTNYFNIMVSNNLKDAFEVAQNLKKGDWAYIKGNDASQSFDTPDGYKQTAVTTYAYKVVKNHKLSETPEPAIG